MRTKSRNIIILTSSILTSLLCIALTFWGNWKNNGVLTTDAFIGILATFIGICATLIVGVQIVNHIELRNMQKSIKEIEEERSSLKHDIKAFNVEMYNTRLGCGNTLAFLAELSRKNNDSVIEFYCWVHSIIIDDWSSMKGSALLARYKRLTELSKTIISCSDKESLEAIYKQLTILVVPDNIDNHDEILSLHYQLLSDLKTSSSDSVNLTK